MKEKILELIELKVALILAKKEHEKEIEKCIENDSYYFIEGGTSPATEEINRLEAEIEKINL